MSLTLRCRAPGTAAAQFSGSCGFPTSASQDKNSQVFGQTLDARSSVDPTSLTGDFDLFPQTLLSSKQTVHAADLQSNSLAQAVFTDSKVLLQVAVYHV